MTQAKTGDTVRFHYTGALGDGTVFSSTVGKEPVEVRLGEEGLIPGLRDALIGMEEGGTKKVSVSPDEAFGERKEGLVASIERSQFPEDIDPEVGMKLVVNTTDGKGTEVTVTDVSDSAVTIDGNHPLAGKELSFELSLLEVVPAPSAS